MMMLGFCVVVLVFLVTVYGTKWYAAVLKKTAATPHGIVATPPPAPEPPLPPMFIFPGSVEQALALKFPTLPPDISINVLEQLEKHVVDAASGRELDGSTIVCGPLRFTHFQPGSAFAIDDPLLGLVAQCAEDQDMSFGEVISASIQLYDEWVKAFKEGRVRPLWNENGRPDFSVLLIRSDAAPADNVEELHMQEKVREQVGLFMKQYNN